MKHGHPLRLAWLLALLLAAGGCAAAKTRQPLDARGDFAAHPSWRGLIVDRLSDGRSALVVHTASLQQPADPSEVVEVGRDSVAALWTPDADRVIVRRSTDPTSPPLGEIAATWRDGILRLDLNPTGGASLTTSRFRRVDSESPPAALESSMSTPWAMRGFPGTYRAELRDEHGAPVGWLRVHILPYQGLPRDYSGDLPASLDGSMAASAVALLDAEIDGIVKNNSFPSDELPGGPVP